MANPTTKVKVSKPGLFSLGKTPEKLDYLRELLTNYPIRSLAVELLNGFQHDFHLHYTGPRIPIECTNLKSVNDSLTVVKEKIGRVAGSFSCRPIATLRCSPLGIIP